jgi:hypothetical protein
MLLPSYIEYYFNNKINEIKIIVSGELYKDDNKQGEL